MAAKETLSNYQARRDFRLTPEPAGDEAPAAGALRFVVQKHWASSLHYDLRLALGGVLKSWAVPKGPSFDPQDKRMAVHVEDHPVSYAGFEGTIPARHYGAGKVIVWDQGTWQPVGDGTRGYRAGNLKFELFGHKLRGRWVLVRIKGKNPKQDPWLLLKESDAFARPAGEFSVVDELPDSVQAVPLLESAGVQLPAGAKPAALPETLAPQLATLAAGAPAEPEQWLCEVKFDGYRLLTRVQGSGIKLLTRNGHDWTSRLRSLHAELARMKLAPGWYDGEIVVPNDAGVPDFGALQRALAADVTSDPTDIVLYLFDLPFFDGHDLRAVPLVARRALLQALLERAASQRVRFSEAFEGAPEEVLQAACRLGLEGVIAKRRDSAYRSRRSADWLKLKCQQRQDFVVGGYTEPRGARVGLGALLLGLRDAAGALVYAGKVGTGFDQATLHALKTRLEALHTPTPPFSKPPEVAGRPHWVAPLLVAQVSFGEWTRGGHIRHAAFHGLRGATSAIAGVPETPASATALAARITHPERVVDAASGVTKIDLVRYYGLVGELMMAHLKGRPVALLRAPDGVAGEQFFQKHAGTDALPGLRQLDPALDPGHAPMLEVANRQGLLSAAQWNVVEFHTLNTGTKSFEHPDRMIFDLDPGEGVAWRQVQEAAELVHALLAQLGLTAFLKTSGGKGLHLVVPLRRLHDWDSVKGFSKAVVVHLARTIAQRFTAKSGPKNRVGKIYVDTLRNGLGASTVSAWSARARPGLGISVPVDWSELGSLKGGDHWTVRTVHTRLDRGNDAWKLYGRAARGLAAAMKLLGYPGEAGGR